MQTFTDDQGRAWDVSVTVGQIEKVLGRIGVDLYDLMAGTLRCVVCGAAWNEVVRLNGEETVTDYRPACKCLVEAGVPPPAADEYDFLRRVERLHSQWAPITLEQRLGQEPELLVNILFVLLESQCEARSVSPESFGAMLAQESGAVFERAFAAFSGEIENFFRRQCEKMKTFARSVLAMTSRGARGKSAVLSTSWRELLQFSQII